MRLGRPRFSIRTGMILVGLVAGLLIASRWAVAKVRLDLARADFVSARASYDNEGGSRATT